MSWSVGFEGNAEEIGKKFDVVADQFEKNGGIAPEVADIRATRDFVAGFAERNGTIQGSASGSWLVYGPDDERNRPSNTNISFTHYDKPATE